MKFSTNLGDVMSLRSINQLLLHWEFVYDNKLFCEQYTVPSPALIGSLKIWLVVGGGMTTATKPLSIFDINRIFPTRIIFNVKYLQCHAGFCLNLV